MRSYSSWIHAPHILNVPRYVNLDTSKKVNARHSLLHADHMISIMEIIHTTWDTRIDSTCPMFVCMFDLWLQGYWSRNFIVFSVVCSRVGACRRFPRLLPCCDARCCSCKMPTTTTSCFESSLKHCSTTWWCATHVRNADWEHVLERVRVCKLGLLLVRWYRHVHFKFSTQFWIQCLVVWPCFD